ncbi:MAG: hypothetical protein ABIQ64_03435 [Candidatus Saccharimonadales bacterium]
MTTPQLSSSGPKKDIIYVDIEDDITSIIDKVKHADSSIVALVPPKRIGVLQSVVNLKLLQRAGENAKKRVVMITSDPALISLAAGAMIPIARNLQSKPEIPVAATADEVEDDVITGDEMNDSLVDDTTVAPGAVAGSTIPTPSVASAAKANARRSGPRVPNFENFRNKGLLIGGGVIAVILLLVWAFVFAPRATVVIGAKTTPYSVNKAVSATPGGTLSVDAGTLGAATKEIAKTASVDFQATGKKDVGEKATGTANYSNSNLNAVSIPAGTKLNSPSGIIFVTDSTVSVPAAVCTGTIFNCSPGKSSGGVTSAQAGSSSNGANGSLSGAPSGVSASFASPSGGGTDKTVTVVSEGDAAAAREKLASENADKIKAELKKQFPGDVMIVDESFAVTPGNPTVSPAVGQEATTAKLTIETKYSLLGLKRTDVAAIIEADLKKQLAGIPNQSIYDKGTDAVRFNSVTKEGANYKLAIQTTGYIGPQIDATKLANQLAGKREGEIIAQVKNYDGIEDVKVEFSPFWVSKAPSADKVIIKFQVNDDKE